MHFLRRPKRSTSKRVSIVKGSSCSFDQCAFHDRWFFNYPDLRAMSRLAKDMRCRSSSLFERPGERGPDLVPSSHRRVRDGNEVVCLLATESSVSVGCTCKLQQRNRALRVESSLLPHCSRFEAPPELLVSRCHDVRQGRTLVLGWSSCSARNTS